MESQAAHVLAVEHAQGVDIGAYEFNLDGAGDGAIGSVHEGVRVDENQHNTTNSTGGCALMGTGTLFPWGLFMLVD